jgi:hypothetical protein
VEAPLQPLRGDLLDGSPPLNVSAGPLEPVALPAGVQVLARLGPQHLPWVLGRAQGAGRVVVVRGSELFRLAPPAGLGEDAERALFRALAWAEADPVQRPLTPGEGEPAKVARLGLGNEDAPGVWTTVRRAQLRDLAARRGRPFLELDGPEELAQAVGRLPPEGPRPLPLPLRRDALATSLAVLLLALEALSRRVARRAG